MTNATHDYYEEIRTLALTADRARLKQLTLTWQMGILGMRLRLTAKQLTSMTGRDLFVYAVDQGWIGKDTVANQDIGKITVTGDHAHAPSTVGGKTTPLKMQFIRQDGVWRLDMMHMMKFANTVMDQLREQTGVPEDEFLDRVVATVTGKRLTDATWEPLTPAADGK